MQKDTQKTKVSFWIEPEQTYSNGKEVRGYEAKNVMAYFPELKNMLGGNKRTVYSHVGQHSECPYDYIDECIKATPDQYKDLAAELEGIGYNLEIL